MELEADARGLPTGSQAITILFVDDDPIIAMATSAMIADLGYTVLTAGSGSHALKILRGDHPVALMITDYSMPAMNGVELAKAAREVIPNLGILLATGYHDVDGGNELQLPLVSKPYDQSQLQAQIERLLASRNQA